MKGLHVLRVDMAGKLSIFVSMQMILSKEVSL